MIPVTLPIQPAPKWMRSIDPVPAWHPLPFTDPLVLAILSGTKTVTRRPFKMERAKVRMLTNVGADKPFGINLSSAESLVQGRIYKASMIEHGAVSAWTRERVPFDNKAGTKVLGKWKPCLIGLRPGEFEWVSPWGAAGDKIWVREVHKFSTAHTCGEGGCECEGVQVMYRADKDARIVYPPADWGFGEQVRPPMFLPRWASRISLNLLEVGVERLHDITEDDARAEGVTPALAGVPKHMLYRQAFKDKWMEIYGAVNWDTNPWVYRLRFEKLP